MTAIYGSIDPDQAILATDMRRFRLDERGGIVSVQDDDTKKIRRLAPRMLMACLGTQHMRDALADHLLELNTRGRLAPVDAVCAAVRYCQDNRGQDRPLIFVLGIEGGELVYYIAVPQQDKPGNPYRGYMFRGDLSGKRRLWCFPDPEELNPRLYAGWDKELADPNMDARDAAARAIAMMHTADPLGRSSRQAVIAVLPRDGDAYFDTEAGGRISCHPAAEAGVIG